MHPRKVGVAWVYKLPGTQESIGLLDGLLREVNGVRIEFAEEKRGAYKEAPRRKFLRDY